MLLQKPRRPDSRPQELNIDAQQCEHYLLGLMRASDRAGWARDVDKAPSSKALPPLPVVKDKDSGEENYTASTQTYRPWPPLQARVADPDTVCTYIFPENAVLYDSPSEYSASDKSPIMTPQSSPGKPSFSSRPASPSTHKPCELCGGDVALSTGFCRRCEEAWTAVEGIDFMQSRTSDAQPERSSAWTDHVSSSSQYSVYSAVTSSDPASSPRRTPCESPGDKSLPQPSALPRPLTRSLQPAPGYGEPRPPLTSLSRKPSPLDSYHRRGSVPQPLTARSLLKPIPELDFERLSPTSRSLIPAPLRTGAEQRTAQSVMYDSFAYYFEDFYFKHKAQVREVRMPRPRRRLAERCAQRVRCGAVGWV